MYGGRDLGTQTENPLEAIPGATEQFHLIRQYAAEARKVCADHKEPPERSKCFCNFFLKVKSAKRKAQGSEIPAQFFLTNIVMQGGGVLGLAHIGFICGLEAAGIRFAGVAGTSAGAIAATGLVCARGDDLQNETGATLYNLVSSMPMGDFVDGPMASRMLIKHWAAKKNLSSLGYILMAVANFIRIFKTRGLNPGRHFETWLGSALAQLGIANNQQLYSLLEKVHAALDKAGVEYSDQFHNGHLTKTTVEKSWDGNQPAENSTTSDNSVKLTPYHHLSVIASAMPSGVKFSFPADLELLKSEYMQRSPALFVRASMSIPLFFEPQRLEPDSVKWRARLAEYFGGIASSSKIRNYEEAKPLAFLDGGIFSNLPLDAFKHFKNVPTLVLTLVEADSSGNHSPKANAKGFIADVANTFDAIRLQRDRDALYHARFEEKLEVIPVDTTGFNWLDFAMPKSQMDQLFLLGLKAAAEYLCGFKIGDEEDES